MYLLSYMQQYNSTQKFVLTVFLDFHIIYVHHVREDFRFVFCFVLVERFGLLLQLKKKRLFL